MKQNKTKTITDYQVMFRDLVHQMERDFGGNIRRVTVTRKVRYDNLTLAASTLPVTVAETYETEIVFEQ